ncbi:hypothetical protein LCGC14_1786450 [marine sediment metagenome]|uniref:Uncharacterized protein n=1 Tax=marine sediment metagenome TaxID=412755 RepID=A0A0F9GTX6_9ZZZZ
MNETINAIKQLRLQLDGLGQLVHDLRLCHPGDFSENSAEVTLAETDVFFAKGWCGQLLSQLGQKTPYKNDGKRKGIKDIEPADDHISEFEDEASYGDKNHIQKVDWLRQAIGVHKGQVLQWSMSPHTFVINQHALWCVQQIWIRLTDARMSLGFELQRISEKAEKKST